jgi:hypothetical protein
MCAPRWWSRLQLKGGDARRPLTMTGTNLLGLIKHLAIWEARYFGLVFGRPFPEPLPRWDVESERLATMWATEHESRADVIDRSKPLPSIPRPRGVVAEP